jgi:hypothetical protein
MYVCLVGHQDIFDVDIIIPSSSANAGTAAAIDDGDDEAARGQMSLSETRSFSNPS